MVVGYSLVVVIGWWWAADGLAADEVATDGAIDISVGVEALRLKIPFLRDNLYAAMLRPNLINKPNPREK